MEDTHIIEKANHLLQSNVYTRNSLAKELKISRHKLDKLASQINNMPRVLTRSQAATHGVKTGRIKWGSSFRLPGSPKQKEK